MAATPATLIVHGPDAEAVVEVADEGPGRVAGIVEAHGGRISVESVAGNGTRFRMALPLHGADQR